MRKLETTLNNILDLISCSDDYGFNDDVLFVAFADMMGKELTEKEIRKYIYDCLPSEAGYSEEDWEQATERLMNFKSKYIDV